MGVSATVTSAERILTAGDKEPETLKVTFLVSETKLIKGKAYKMILVLCNFIIIDIIFTMISISTHKPKLIYSIAIKSKVRNKDKANKECRH